MAVSLPTPTRRLVLGGALGAGGLAAAALACRASPADDVIPQILPASPAIGPMGPELRTLVAHGDNGDSLNLGDHLVAVLVRGLTENLGALS